MTKKKTHEEFIEQLNKIHGEGEYIPLDEYKDSKTKMRIRHNQCGYEWRVIPSNILRGSKCPKCVGNQQKTQEEFIEEIREKYGDEYKILSEYVNWKTKIKIKHNSDGCKFHEYEVTPNNLLRGKGCPVCTNQKTVLGVNTIWDTDRWMVDLGVSEEDAKKYGSQSNKKITVKCLDCGREKRIKLNQIYRDKSIRCICGDGVSYPEKFIMNLLDQLNVDFKKEYSPNWTDDKRYDFYIPKLNYIIEAHGRQHYDNHSFSYCGGRTLEEEQENDKYKKELALKNGVKCYIEIDCRESSLDYIKNSILNSELNKLFNLSQINWTSCAEFANKNIVREVCDYWNNRREDETTTDLVKVFKLGRTTIIEYLNKGNKLSWCNYNGNKKKVSVFKDNKSLGIFDSCHELERQSKELFGTKLLYQSVASVCRGEKKNYKGFIFKYIYRK